MPLDQRVQFVICISITACAKSKSIGLAPYPLSQPVRDFVCAHVSKPSKVHMI
jgi:hypothetical protein